MSLLTERPIADPGPVPDPPAMTLTCQRCGARDRLWTVSTQSHDVGGAFYNAHLCGLCARGVLSSIESCAPYDGPVKVDFTLLEVTRT